MANKHITFQNSVVLTDIALIRNLNGVKGDVAEVASAQVHGSFWFDITDTTTSDDGRTCIVAVDGGRWKLILLDADAIEYQPGSASAYRDGSVGAALAGLEHDNAALTGAVFSSGGLEDTVAATQAALIVYETSIASPSNGNGADRVGGVGRVVTNITTLKALAKTGVGRAFVLSDSVMGDGGGGQFYVDTADTTSADNGSTTRVASDGGRWKLAHTGTVSIKQGGCKVDGNTDDTVALTALLTVAGVQGFEVYHPGGICNITGILVTHQRLVLRGSGYNAVFNISGAVGSYGFQFVDPAGSGTHFGSGFRGFDFRITCTASANKIQGIWANNAELESMERVFIDLSGNTFAGAARNATFGFLGDYQQDGIFIKCHFTAGGGAFADGVFLTGDINDRKPNNNQFLGCRGQSCGGYGFRNSIGDGNVWIGGKLQGNGLGGWVEANDGAGNGPSNTLIMATGFEINGGDDIHVEIANHLIFRSNVMQSITATNHVNLLFGTACEFWGNFSFAGKPVNIASGSNNRWDVQQRGFGTITFAAGTMVAMGERRGVLVDGASVAVDASKGTYFTLTGSTGRAIAAPSNSADAQIITFEFENTSGSPITHTWDPNYKVSSWGPIAAGKIATTTYQYNLARFLWMQVGAPILDL